MKRAYFCVIQAIILFFLSFESIQAQQLYYQQPDGKILNTEGFGQFKNNMLSRLRQMNPDFSILDEGLQEVRRSTDSVVYAFQLKLGTAKPATDRNSTLPSKLMVGDTLPAMKLQTLNGDWIDLQQLKGKPTLLNFWFAKCSPCIEEMPALGSIKSSFGDRIQFISVTYESSVTVKEFLTRHQFPFLHIPEAQALIDLIGVRGYPVNVFLDRQLIVRRIENGIPTEWKSDKDIKAGDGEEFKKYLERLLN
jgi:cytochrome c biogenesis protein CcmG/thiol:disulfide interchange protein DsbE